MPSWFKVANLIGVYESEIFNISNTLSKYTTLIEIAYTNPNNKRMDFYYSVSTDNVNWSSWTVFYKESFELLDGYNLTNLYFKYKVVFETDDANDKAYLQSISFTLTPLELFVNISDLSLKPKLWIRKVDSNGDIQIINHYTKQIIELKDLRRNEEVFVDCENEDIISSLQNIGVYRFDSHNNEWLELEVGNSYIRGVGDFDLDIRYQGKLLQE